MPPRCAQCATVSKAKFFTPIKSSMAPYMNTKYLALMGMGGNNNISSTLGNNMPKAKRMPNTAPDAPTVRWAFRYSVSNWGRNSLDRAKALVGSETAKLLYESIKPFNNRCASNEWACHKCRGRPPATHGWVATCKHPRL